MGQDRDKKAKLKDNVGIKTQQGQQQVKRAIESIVVEVSLRV